MLKKHFEEQVVPMVIDQIQEDEKRWGETWSHRPIDGQEERIFARFNDYYDHFVYGKEEIPWLKIIGLCNIAMMRKAHPELLNSEK